MQFDNKLEFYLLINTSLQLGLSTTFLFSCELASKYILFSSSFFHNCSGFYLIAYSNGVLYSVVM